MTKIFLITILSLMTSLSVLAQQQDSTVITPEQVEEPVMPPEQKEEPAPPAESGQSKVFYGGTLGVSFGSYFRLSVQPMVGYNITPKLSGGVKVIYEYISDTRTNQTFTWHNYGASVFARYRIIPQIYGHAEFAYMSYDTPGDRVAVPFLLLGGGYVQRLGSNAGLYVEVLFDVLQDDNSPYDSGSPFISIGAAVGI